MTNEEILKVYKGIADLSKNNIVLNIKTSYILAKNRQLLASYVQIIEEKKIELYQKYGTINEDATVTIPKENMQTLEKELKTLMEIKNKVEITKITLDDLGENKISIEILENLMPIIIEE